MTSLRRVVVPVLATCVLALGAAQSLLFYLAGANPDRIKELVRFLRQQPLVDVVFTHGGTEGSEERG